MANRPNQFVGLVAGDKGIVRTYRIDGAADLTAVTSVVPRVWKPGTAVVELTGAVVDSGASARSISITWGSWLESTATAGEWSVEVELRQGSTPIETWPTSPATVIVRAQGA